MKYLPILFLIRSATALEWKENIKLTVKKCCPKGQELNSALLCVNVARDLENNKVNNAKDVGKEPSYFSNNPSKIFFPDFNDTSAENDSIIEERFPWFPFASLVNSVTLREFVDLESIKDLFDDANFEYGARPECGTLEKEFSCFRLKYSEQFYLVLYPEQDIKLYISKESSYHEEGHFKVENRDCGFSKIDPGENNTRGGRESGDLLWKPLFNLHEMRTFPWEDFCLDKGPKGTFLVEYCPCKSVPCVRKCCSDSELYDGVNDICVPNSTFGFWRPLLSNSSLTKNYYLLPKKQPSKCEKPVLLKLPQWGERNLKGKCGRRQEGRNKFHFLSDGSLQVKNRVVPAEAYCGDHVIYDSVLLENNFLICQQDDESEPKFRVYGIFFIIGGVILLVATAISLLIPELKTSTFSKIIICHNVALLLADFFQGTAALLLPTTSTICTFLGLSIQATILGSHFWMSALCWEVLLVVRCVKSSRQSIGDNRKFLNYAIFACTVPVIIVCVSSAMEFAPSLPPHYIRPGFDCYCGFNPDSESIFFYLYAPMSAIILVNLILFFGGFIQAVKFQNDTGNEAKKKSMRNKSFVTFSKFFLSVEFAWLLEIVGWFLRGKDYFWYFPDFLTVLVAAFVFVILIWEKNVLRSFMRKFKDCSDGIDRSRQNSATESDLEEVRRREKILRKQITQTFRMSDESDN